MEKLAKKNKKRINLDDVYEKLIITLFLEDQKIYNKSYYAQDAHSLFESPDCIVPENKLCIEVTAIQCFDVVDSLDHPENTKFSHQKFLYLKWDEKNKLDLVNQRIKKAVIKKDNKPSYSDLPLKYESRILLIRVDGNCLNWKNDFEAITENVKILNLQSKIFNHIYLVMYPLIPTTFEIENKIFERPERSDFIRIF